MKNSKNHDCRSAPRENEGARGGRRGDAPLLCFASDVARGNNRTVLDAITGTRAALGLNFVCDALHRDLVETHLAIAIARSRIRAGVRGRFFDAVDLVNHLESEARNGHPGRLADYLTRMDCIILGELGYLPFAQTGGRLSLST